MHADLVLSVRLNVLDHLRVEERAHRGDVEGRRHVLPREHAENAGETVDGAVFTARQRFRSEIAAPKRGRRVIDVEAQRHRDLGAVRPRRRFEPPAGTEMEHLPFQLIDR